MQTFLVCGNFTDNAACLDRSRLGKQRIECRQILLALLAAPGKRGWQNHPATLRWKGHEVALCNYAICICIEWRLRGYVDNQFWFFWDMNTTLMRKGWNKDLPPFVTDPKFHRQHRDILMAKARIALINTGDDYLVKWYKEKFRGLQ